MTSGTVYAVWHVHDLGNGEEDWKFVGVYSSSKSAADACARVGLLPGFRDGPADAFRVDELTLDEDLWTEGYETRDEE